MFIHNLQPVAFKIFNINIHWYSLAYLFGFLFSVFFSKFIIKIKKLDLKVNLIDDFLTYAVLGVIIGGRIGYVIFYNIEFYLSYPIEIFKIWTGGMSFHGGLIGLITATFIFSKRKKIDFLVLSNIISICAPVGIFFGRIANFINGELYGKKTELPWGVIFDSSKMIAHHPTQLYEALFEGLVLFFIMLISLNNKFYNKFHSCAIFLIFYSIFRFIIEFVRLPDEQLGYLIFNLTMGQMLSIPMLLLGLYILRK